MYQKLCITLVLALACCANLAAQTYGYNYQAVVSDGNGQPLKNQAISLQFQILRTPIQTLNPSYAETHNNLTTDQFGLVTAVVGKGILDMGRFDTISWQNGPRYLKVLIKTTSSSGFVPLGEAKEIVHAPFAGGSGIFIRQADTIRLQDQNAHLILGKGDPKYKFSVDGILVLLKMQKVPIPNP